MRRRFALTTILNVIGVGVGFSASLIITPFALHTLGKEAYGVWVLVTSFSVVSGYLSLLDFGVQSSVVKFVAEHHARQEVGAINQIFSAGLYLFGGLGVLGAIALTLFARLFLTRVFNIPPHLVGVMRLLLYLLAVQTLVEFPGLIFSAVLDGLQRYDLQRMIQIGYVVLYAVILVILLLHGYGLMALSITTLVLAVGRTLIMAILSRRLLPELRLVGRLDMELLRRIAGFSAQVFLIRINAVIYNTMDKVIIGALLTSTLLTDYDIADKLRNVVLVSLSLITPQVVPVTSRLDAAGDRASLQELFLRGTKYQLAMCLPVAVSVLVLAERLIRLWIGPDYAYTANLARLFVSYLFLDAVVVVGQNMMFGMNRVKPLILIQAITQTGINSVVSVVLTPKIGVAGVMWGTLIGTACSVGPYLWLYLRSLDVRWGRFWRESLWPPYSMSALFAVFLYAGDRLMTPDNIWTLGGLGLVGLAAYGLLFTVFGLSSAERTMLLQAVRPRP